MTQDVGTAAKPDFLAWVKGLKERAEVSDSMPEGRVWTPIGELPRP